MNTLITLLISLFTAFGSCTSSALPGDTGSGGTCTTEPSPVESPVADAGRTAVPANDFLNSIGVNSAIDDRFEHKEQTAESMRYIGARWIRSGAQRSTDVFEYMMANVPHLRFSMMFDPAGNDRVFEQASWLKSRGALIALEGVNEPNNWWITYKGQNSGGRYSWKGLAEMQRDSYADTKARLGDVDVWSITETGAERDNYGLQFAQIPEGTDCLMPAGTKYYDCLNVHNYFIHPRWPAHSDNQTWIAAESGKKGLVVDGVYDNHGKTWAFGYDGYSEEQLKAARKVTTETGCTLSSYKVWSDDGGRPHAKYTEVQDPNSFVSEEEQGLLYMSCYLAQFAQGFEYTAMYILRDRTDEAGNQSFGMVEPLEWEEAPLHGYHQRYRKAADYMHNLTTILADNSSIKTPGRLDYGIADCPETVHDLLLQKSDGTFCLVIWGENYAGGSNEVTVSFGKKHDFRIYDPTIGTDVVRTVRKSDKVSLTMTNKPYIIQLKK